MITGLDIDDDDYICFLLFVRMRSSNVLLVFVILVGDVIRFSKL